MINRLKRDFSVHSYEADFKGRATITAIMQFMQETAWQHAEKLGLGYKSLLTKNMIWVLSRLRLQMDYFPRWQENLSVETWPSGMDNLFCYRDHRIYDQDGSPCGKATSTWLVIDIGSRRPQRVSSYLGDTKFEKIMENFSEYAEKLKKVENPEHSTENQIRYSDIDVHAHLNNVKYIEFIMNSYPIDFIKNNDPAEMVINFLNEAEGGEKITINRSDLGNNEFLHNITRASDNAEMSRIKMKWRKL